MTDGHKSHEKARKENRLCGFLPVLRSEIATEGGCLFVAEVQIYVIVAGRGRMLVGEEQKEVSTGELIYVPSGLMHGIENLGEGTLSYVSAANPAFDYTEAYDRGQLVGNAYLKNDAAA